MKPLVLARQGKVPDDAAVRHRGRAATDLFPPELDALDAYLGRGGKLLAMVEPVRRTEQAEGLKHLLGRYGFELGDDLVVELNPIGRLFGIGPEVPIVQQYESHPITRDLAGITTLFPLTRSVGSAKTPPTGVSVQPLAAPARRAGARPTGAAAARGRRSPIPRTPRARSPWPRSRPRTRPAIVVYGTSNLAANQFLNSRATATSSSTRCPGWPSRRITSPSGPRTRSRCPVFLTLQQAQVVFLLPVVILPGLVLVGGIIAVVRRRAAK